MDMGNLIEMKNSFLLTTIKTIGTKTNINLPNNPYTSPIDS